MRNKDDIQIFAGGAWRSMMRAKIYANGKWNDFYKNVFYINPIDCNLCGDCKSICDANGYNAVDFAGGIFSIDAMKCVGCSFCFQSCPVQVIYPYMYSGAIYANDDWNRIGTPAEFDLTLGSLARVQNNFGFAMEMPVTFRIHFSDGSVIVKNVNTLPDYQGNYNSQVMYYPADGEVYSKISVSDMGATLDAVTLEYPPDVTVPNAENALAFVQTPFNIRFYMTDPGDMLTTGLGLLTVTGNTLRIDFTPENVDVYNPRHITVADLVALGGLNIAMFAAEIEFEI